MCCLFGLMDYGCNFNGRQKSRILAVLSKECEVRGTDATGIAYNVNRKLHIYKRPVAAHKLHFWIPNNALAVMGHTRMTTQGSEKKNYNNHPFYGNAGEIDFALAHNGVLHNDWELRKIKHLPKTKIQTDSYITVQLIEQQKALNLNSLKSAVEQVDGSFSFTVLDGQNSLYFVKGDNPLCIYRYPKTGLLLYASTAEILCRALVKLNLPIEKPESLELGCGDIALVNACGGITMGSFDTDHLLHNWYTEHYVPFGWSGWNMRNNTSKKATENAYIQELKSVAGAFGYTPDDVDNLLAEGFSPEELEEYFYCGE